MNVVRELLPCTRRGHSHKLSVAFKARDSSKVTSHQQKRLCCTVAESDASIAHAATAKTTHRALPHRRDVLIGALSIVSSACFSSAVSQPARASIVVDEETSTSIYEAASPSVASVSIVQTQQGIEKVEAVGSGFIWDRFGHVVTNFHVIPPLKGTSTRLQVTYTDAAGLTATVPAVVAGSDSLHDIAVLRLLPSPAPGSAPPLPGPLPPTPAGAPAAEGGAAAAAADADAGVGGGVRAGEEVEAAPERPLDVVPVRMGSSADLRVGQHVYALGFPPVPALSRPPPGREGACCRTLSAGLVGGLDRSIASPVGGRIYGVIQTDALVNAANSGGPLLDSYGRLVGMCTAVGATRSTTGRGSGVYFALPADLLREIVPKLIVYGNAYGKK